MNALVFNEGEIARVALMKTMLSFVERRRPRHVPQDGVCPKHFLHGAGCIISRGQIPKHAADSIYRFMEFLRRVTLVQISQLPRRCRSVLLVNGTASHWRLPF